MKAGGNGTIVMESRKQDIEPLMEILNEWLQDHPENMNSDKAEELLCILDFMHMSW